MPEPVGRLTWRIELDNPAMVHCGSDSPITGNVVLHFSTHLTTTEHAPLELFGPLHMTVCLTGRAKSKIWKHSGNHDTIYRGRAPLLVLKSEIHNGSVKMAGGSQQRFPFILHFPEAVHQSQIQAQWRSKPDFDHHPGAPLPPSMFYAYHGFNNRFECFVEYRINAEVTMRQINVKIISAMGEEGALLYYQPTQMSSVITRQPIRPSFVVRETVAIQNKYLLPEAERPSGFLQNAKKLFDSDPYPSFVYTCTVQGSTTVHLNQPLTFGLTLRPDLQRCNVPTIPDMKVSGLRVKLKGQTEVRAEALLSEPQSHGRETIIELAGKLEPGDFSKDNDFTKTVKVAAVSGFPSSFSTFNITRTYSMIVSLDVTTANKTKRIEGEFRIILLPPVAVTNSSEPSRAGPASQEAGPSTDGDQLPQYQAPPSYDRIEEA